MRRRTSHARVRRNVAQPKEALGRRLVRYSKWFAGFSVCVILTFAALKFNRAYPIKQVAVKGDYVYTQGAAIESVLSPYLLRGFFTIRLSKMREALLTLPWLETVVARKVWPDKVEFTLTEKQPVAIWNRNFLLTEQGVLFQPNPMPDLLLVKLEGPQGKELDVLKNYYKMAKILAKTELSIVRLTLSDRLAWRLTINDGMILELGHEEPQVRLRRFANTYKQVFKNSRKPAQHVDLRYPHGYAVKWGDS